MVRPQTRIWPPPKKDSWQYIITWISFSIAFALNGLFIFLDWNSWILQDDARLLIGIPVTLTGFLLFLWGITTLGTKNTSGLKNGFIRRGPYRYTRNPQYLGDIFLFVGIILISNSIYLAITNSLLILVFLITPYPEEIWLEEQYGEEYIAYKQATSRFF